MGKAANRDAGLARISSGVQTRARLLSIQLHKGRVSSTKRSRTSSLSKQQSTIVSSSSSSSPPLLTVDSTMKNNGYTSTMKNNGYTSTRRTSFSTLQENARTASHDQLLNGSSSTCDDAKTPFDLPSWRIVRRLDALRATPRLNDEGCDDESFSKRHEKHEKLEKQIVRRDKAWQRENSYRQRLLKLDNPNEFPRLPPILAIEICKKLPKDCIRRSSSSSKIPR